MATLKQYFETDFSNAVRVDVSFKYQNETHAGAVLYDLIANSAFVACYITGESRSYDYFRGFLETLQYGATKLDFRGNITLPAAKTFPGVLRVANNKEIGLEYQLVGDYTWRSAQEISGSRRVFIYAECALIPAEVTRLQEEAERLGHKLQFRSADYLQFHTKYEHSLAFISHDWRDKEAVAKPIAVTLQRMLCPVWYDEFSLQVGDRLRESIEKGLKACKKCILVLSLNFFSNEGWTKKEFDSIFTREILEQTSLILPVWFGVTKHEVYDYSPSLANVVGLSWDLLGLDEVCRRLFRVIAE
jgi:hypothetical protein